MSDSENETNEEDIDESGRNATQRRLDEESGGGEPVPVDAEWPKGKEEGQ